MERKSSDLRQETVVTEETEAGNKAQSKAP